MPKICYEEKSFRPDSLQLIQKANEIIALYQRQGFSLTLRQLYYQLVSQNVIPNKERAYKNLGNLISDARLAGLVDWEALEDRTRNLRENPHWSSPADIIEACAQSFRRNLWESQPTYVEVWIEKDALVGVIEGVCTAYDVPHFSCRGYTSASEMWVAGMRIAREVRRNHLRAVVLHLGDHDPSGIDMTRDIRDRLMLFTKLFNKLEVRRIALTREQIDEFGLPPNPAKVTDPRASDYIEENGEESWELDALTPTFISGLIEENLNGLLAQDLFERMKARQAEGRALLTTASREWEGLESYIRDNFDVEDHNGDQSE